MKVDDKVLTPVGTGFVFYVDTMYQVARVKLDTVEVEPKLQNFKFNELTVLE